MSQAAYPERPQATAIPPQSQTGEINVLRLFGVIVRHIWLIVAFGLVLGLYTLLTGLTAPHYFSADASFIPQGTHAQSTSSALAAQFGIAASTGEEGGQSPQFYVDLLKSREILRGVVHATYTVRTDTGVVTGDLIRILGVKGKTPLLREVVAMEKLSGFVSANVSLKTGVIKLSATALYPDLAAELVASFLQQINRFNLEGRQSRASEERKFTEKRLHEAQIALTDAEDRLEEFLRTNRDVGAPSLQLQHGRLSRTVDTRQQIYTALAQADEQARIEEVRDTPAITIIEPPNQPIAPISRGTVSRSIKSFVFGLLLGTLLAFLLDFLKRSGARDSEGLRELLAVAREKLRHPFRRIRSAGATNQP
jgi:uncharacterized protein involved in exopolysaccharide biosynthesis